MTLQFRKSVLVLALTSLLPVAAHAHRQWLLPAASNVESREPWAVVDAGVAENLFDLEMPLKLDGLVITGPDGAALNADNILNGKQRNTIELKLAKPGTYRFALVSESVSASYKLNGEQKRFRGTAETFATDIPKNAEDVQKTVTFSRNETFVSTGTPNDTALKPTNVGLELVPLSSPTELYAGEKTRFRLLIDGKPAAKLGVSLIPGGVKYRGVLNEVRVVTDDKGEITVTWPSAGAYQVSASWPARAPAGEGGGAPGGEGKGPGGPGAQGPGGPGGFGGPQPPRRLSYAATLEVLPP